ncbi:ABC transporter ATP-binding protein [Pseudonocardia sp. GCM10023141]|uniref:ABC transporter ATP-binding protein n=1 Tax=Pseudonocardia sp. GCM10023141 TaxID=3252653 RepID=UPI0036073E74
MTTQHARGGARSASVTAASVLTVVDVSVWFGGVKALDGVSLQVRPKAITGLVGPNGAGKSTLFGVVSGLRRPQAGRVALLGADVTGASAQQRARLGLGRTFQQPELFMGLSIREHLVLAYRLRHHRARVWRDMLTGAGLRRSPAAENERVDALLELLGLTAVAERRAASLPLGTCRLVEVGRALAGDPSVLLLDEPLAGLDPREADRLAAALRLTVDTEGTAMLLVEHDVDMVMSLSAHVVVLDFGVVLAAGRPAEVRADPQVRAAYLGDDAVAVPTGTQVRT